MSLYYFVISLVMLSCAFDQVNTCYCWVHCCRCLGTVSWGRLVEGSRSQLWRISSGKGLHLLSGGRSVEDYLLLLVENRRVLSECVKQAGVGLVLGLDRMVSGVNLRTLFFERGTSHSGGANSFSPSELLLWPASGTELLDNSLANREGRPSSSFPSTAKTNMSQTYPVKSSWQHLSRMKLTSLFLQRFGLWDVGERVESFGCEALALFVLQWCYIWQLQRTEDNR